MLQHLQPRKTPRRRPRLRRRPAFPSGVRSSRSTAGSASSSSAGCEADGFEVIVGDEVIWQNDIAVRNGRRMAAAAVDAVVFNFSVWAWPQYARVAAQFCPQPIVMFSNVNPQYPGARRDARQFRVARSGGDSVHEELRRRRGRRRCSARLRSQIAGVAAARRLRGLTYCLIGGRSLGHRHHRDRSGAVERSSSASTSTTSTSSSWCAAPAWSWRAAAAWRRRSST